MAWLARGSCRDNYRLTDPEGNYLEDPLGRPLYDPRVDIFTVSGSCRDISTATWASVAQGCRSVGQGSMIQSGEEDVLLSDEPGVGGGSFHYREFVSCRDG